jgi:hypothetical protein
MSLKLVKLATELGAVWVNPEHVSGLYWSLSLQRTVVFIQKKEFMINAQPELVAKKLLGEL